MGIAVAVTEGLAEVRVRGEPAILPELHRLARALNRMVGRIGRREPSRQQLETIHLLPILPCVDHQRGVRN